MKTKMKTMTSFAAAAGLSMLALLFTTEPARAELGPPVSCEATREGVSTDLMLLAGDTRAAAEIVVANARAGNIADKLARKLFLDRTALGLPNAGAAQQVLQGKDDSAVASINDYIAGWQKTKVTSSGEALKEQFIEQATALIGCVNGVRGLDPVQ